MTAQEEQFQIRIRELEKEVARLHSQIKEQRYGLTWLDVPEAFETESENKIPILEEVKDKAIDKGGDCPPHILIEGDNYHALTCLNYTHRGKIDVIYIDPPYNTGNDGFVYKDKRMLTEFPDGTLVPNEHPLRHSYWLSFMSKRLELAKNLLSDKGVIFISIDDNEQANLKLLCDKVFGEENFVETFLWNKTATPPALSYKSRKTHEYVHCYQKMQNSDKFVGLVSEGGDAPLLNEINRETILNFPANYVITSLSNGIYHAGKRERVELMNDVVVSDGIITTEFSLRGHFRWQQSTLDAEIENKCILKVKSDKFAIRYCRQGDRTVAPPNFITERFYKKDTSIDKEHNVDTNEQAGKELTDVLGVKKFDFPKPTSLISYLISFNNNTHSTILDFFAGSGTTMHATMKLNAEDGGHRQCILVQQKEGENNICENVTYERNKRVMCGYTNAKGEQVEGLGGKLKYYKTAFVGKNQSKNATDADKVELAQKAGCLLAMGENTLEEFVSEESYQLFKDDKGKFTAVYFTGDLEKFPEFVAEIEKIQQDESANIAVYIFCWGAVDMYENEFDNIRGITLKSIPQPILDIYKSINA